jgi:PAS domain S-box-containing protein
LKNNEFHQDNLITQAEAYQLYNKKNINKALIDALNNAKIGYCILQNRDKEEGVFIEVNEIFAEMVGHEKEDIIGKTYRDILHPVSQSLLQGRFRKRQMGRKIPTQYELLANRKNNRLATLEVNESTANYKGKEATILIVKDITTKKKLEHSLIQDKQFFKKLINNAAAAIVSSNEEDAIVEWNKAAELIFGYTRDEAIGKNIDDLIAKGPRYQEAIQISQRVRNGEQILGFETSRYKKNGTMVHVCISGAPIIIKNTYRGKITIYRDITELKEMTEELKRSEKKYRELFEYASDAIFTLDTAGNFTSVNRMFEQISGFSREEIVNTNFSSLVLKENCNELINNWSKILNFQHRSIEIDLKRKDGESRTLSITISYIFKNRQLIGLQGVARDITKRKKLELQLKESEEQFKGIFENANDSIVILDKKGFFILANSKFTEITGYNKNEIDNIHFTKYIVPEDREHVLTHFDKIVNEHINPQRIEVRGLCSDGSLRYFDMNTNIIKKETDVVGIQTILRDVTEKKILEERLKKNYKELIKMLTAFIEVKDLYTEKHSKRIASDSVFLAEQLSMSSKEIKDIEIAALLHDLGKIKISIDILNKESKLNEKEWEIMKKHSEIGEQTIKNMPEFLDASKLIKYHHERYDGKGYPKGLIGEEIPIGARIIALVDAFDAMQSNRPYRKALSYEEAKKELIREKGKQFDPYITDIYLKYLEQKYEHK